MKSKAPMPGYYRKNVVKNVQRKILLRKKREREAKLATGARETKKTGEEK